MEEDILAKEQLIRELKRDVHERDKHVSDLSAEIRQLTGQLNSQIKFAKEKEKECDEVHVDMEGMREELVQLRRQNKILKETTVQLTEELNNK